MSYMNPMAFLENMCSLSLRWCYPSRQLSKQPGHRDVFGGCMTFTQNFNFPKTKQHRYIAPENRPKPKKRNFILPDKASFSGGKNWHALTGVFHGGIGSQIYLSYWIQELDVEFWICWIQESDLEFKSQMFFLMFALFSFPYPEVVCVFRSSGMFFGVPNTNLFRRYV